MKAARTKTAQTKRQEMPQIPAAEALSFLKDTKGMLSWTAREMAATLNISPEDAQQVVPLLELQGYVKPVHTKAGEWMTTPEGEAISGAKAPRYTRKTIENALSALTARINALNGERGADFQVRNAVAFGDFLSERPLAQAAEVGILLVRRNPKGREPNSAVEQAARRQFLQKLRGRSALLHLRPYEPWMSHRSHRKLVGLTRFRMNACRDGEVRSSPGP